MYSPRELWKVKRAKILSVRWLINGGFISGLKKRFKARYIVVWSKYAFDFLLFSSVKTSWKIEFISIRTWGGAYRRMHFLLLQVYGPITGGFTVFHIFKSRLFSALPNFVCFWVKPSPVLGSVYQVGRLVRWNVSWVLFVLFVVGCTFPLQVWSSDLCKWNIRARLVDKTFSLLCVANSS